MLNFYSPRDDLQYPAGEVSLDTPAHFRCVLWNAIHIRSRARNCLVSGFNGLSEWHSNLLALVTPVHA